MQLSIVIPVFNVERYINQCLDSLINLDDLEYEIIIIDDGSTDNSRSIINSYCLQYSNIKLLTQVNQGVAAARNFGIHSSKGEYILFIDSDDYLLNPFSVSAMYKKAKNRNIDILIGNGMYIRDSENYRVIHSNKDIFFERQLSAVDYLKEVLAKKVYIPVVWLNMYKRELFFNNNCFFKSGRLNEDEDFSLRILLGAQSIYIYPECFYAYRLRDGSLSKQYDKTENSRHLIKTCSELADSFEEINDKQLKRLLLDYLATLYINAIEMGNIKKIETKDFKKFFNCARSFKNQLRMVLLLLNPVYYYKIKCLLKNL